jgi:hypothetical protein
MRESAADYLPHDSLPGSARGCLCSYGRAVRVINRYFAIVPSIQAITSVYPNCSISGHENAPVGITRQSLVHGKSGDGKAAKAVQTVLGGCPDIPFTVLKENVYRVAGKAFGPRKHVCLSLMHV